MADKEPPTALKLLSKAHEAELASRIYTEKIIQKPLHLQPTSVPPTTQIQRREARISRKTLQKRKKALKPAPLSSRQRKALMVHALPPKVSYSSFLPLHALWERYIQELLGLTSSKGDEMGKVKRFIGTQETSKLCSADYHGAQVTVVRSRCVSRVGIKGIVVKDGMRAFEIVVREGSESADVGIVKRIPKEGTLFGVVIGLPADEGAREEEGDARKETKSLKFEIHGDQFIYRAADRANRKFKTHFNRDL